MAFIGLSAMEWLALGFTLGMVALCILLDASSRKTSKQKKIDEWI
jgi:hypothetical protein